MRYRMMLCAAVGLLAAALLAPGTASAHNTCWNASGTRYCATEASHYPNLKGWAYVAGTGNVHAWRYAGGTWPATTIKAGTWVYISPMNASWYWTWFPASKQWGAMHAHDLMYTWQP